MNRLQFLKTVLGSVAAVLVAPSVLSSHKRVVTQPHYTTVYIDAKTIRAGDLMMDENRNLYYCTGREGDLTRLKTASFQYKNKPGEYLAQIMTPYSESDRVCYDLSKYRIIQRST